MNFNPAMSGGAGGMFPGAANFPPFFAHHAVQMSGGWGMPGGEFNGAGDDRHPHHPGPMRRGGGGGNYRNNRIGPYDRRPRDGRDMRWNGTSGNNNNNMMMGGRMSPSRIGGGAGSGGGPPGGRSGAGGFNNKWGDGGAGSATVGPREAVQGRSLKSYEDLDAAVGGSAGAAGSGELNY